MLKKLPLPGFCKCIQGIFLLCLMAIVLSCSGNQAGVKDPRPESLNPEIVKATLAKDIQSTGSRKEPKQPGNLFSPDDDKVVAYINYKNLAGTHKFRWLWVDPYGNEYLDTDEYTVRAPAGEYIETGSAWHHINIREEKAMALTGKWQVKMFMDERLIAAKSFHLSDTGEPIGMPPMLSIEEISFSKPYLEGGEAGELHVAIKNTGSGVARDVFLVIESNTPALEFETRQELPKIPAEDGQVTAAIPVKATKSVQAGKAAVDIQVVEPRFKVKIQGKRVMIPTRPFRNPELEIVKFAALESQSAQQNNQIDINEVIDVRFAVQNIGQGPAKDINVSVENNQSGVMFLGRGEGSRLKKEQSVQISELAPGKFEILNYRYFVNSDFTAKELAFEVQADESHQAYGFNETKTVAINTELTPEGRIQEVEVAGDFDTKGVVIEDIPDFQVDVDVNIPETDMSRPDAIAVIIGNRNYQHKDIPVVKYAHRDARVIKSYLVKTLGFDERNIITASDITKARFEAIFGIRDNPNGRLADYIKPGQSEVFIYYSGHGAPDPDNRKGYFVPIDCDPDKISLNGYSLDVFYENLEQLKAETITVVLEACFSGGTSPGEMIIQSASPALIRVENSEPEGRRTTVVASSQSDQISSWYNDKHHGLFTYFFLKALGGQGDLDGNGRITLAEVHNYVSDRTSGVPYWARRLHGRDQMPVISGAMRDQVLVSYE